MENVVRKRSRNITLTERMIRRLKGHPKKWVLKVAFEQGR
jgi:hypothetical protein